MPEILLIKKLLTNQFIPGRDVTGGGISVSNLKYPQIQHQ
jgi:hypothetical protein